jgi:hypothetical protein
MQHLRTTIFLILSIILFENCTSKKGTDVVELDKLNLTYAQSIQLPIDKIDLLIYKPAGICGNTSDEEFRSFFIPYLLDEPYKKTIEAKYHSLRIINSNQLDSLKEKQGFNKLSVEFWGDRKSRTSVEVNERFEYKNEVINIKKICTYQNNEWVVRVK